MESLCKTFEDSLSLSHFDSGNGSILSSTIHDHSPYYCSPSDKSDVSVPSAQQCEEILPKTLDQNSDLVCVRVNGRKVFGPPSDWIGAPPNTSELFVKHIPRIIDDYELLEHFRRMGHVYEVRLMVDFKNENRGFAYLRYIDERSTCKAIELLNHVYVCQHRKFIVERSYDKCSLFIGNISKFLSRGEIENELFLMFPGLKNVVIPSPHPRDAATKSVRNGGFVFLHFPTHNAAVQAKQMTSTGRCRLWGRDVKIVWSNPKSHIEDEEMAKVKTLYVGNVDMCVTNRDIKDILKQIVRREEIVNVARSRESVFITFVNRDAAQFVLENLQGFVIQNRAMDIKWGIPPKENSLHASIHIDFEAQLRLKCIANNWMAPLYLFGRVFSENRVQYLAVTVGHPGIPITIYMELTFTTDMQARAAEVVVALIEHRGGIPEHHYVIKVESDVYHIVGVVRKQPNFSVQPAHDLPTTLPLHICLKEIFDLAAAIQWFMFYTSKDLQTMHTNGLAYFRGFIPNTFVNQRTFGCMNPYQYRTPTELRHGLDQSQLLFVLCDAITMTNYMFKNYAADWYMLASGTINVYCNVAYKSMPLMKPKAGTNTAIYFGPLRFVDRQAGERKVTARPFSAQTAGVVAGE